MKKMESDETMILREVMESANSDDTYFIGAATGYLFIGTLAKYKADFPKLNARAHVELIKKSEKINTAIGEINELIDKENQGGDGVEINRIQNLITSVRKNLYERDVVDIYSKILDGEESGTAVIIRGGESGAFWLKSEYDKKGEKQ